MKTIIFFSLLLTIGLTGCGTLPKDSEVAQNRTTTVLGVDAQIPIPNFPLRVIIGLVRDQQTRVPVGTNGAPNVVVATDAGNQGLFNVKAHTVMGTGDIGVQQPSVAVHTFVTNHAPTKIEFKTNPSIR